LSTEQADHRAFLNRYYGVSRYFYDVSRKYYLLGRDKALEQLLAEDWSSLIEVGPGTGRNLAKLHEARPSARLGGVEASDAMLDHARKRCPWASLEHGFAENADFTSVLGTKPDRILFSYCLSMVQDPVAALENARRSVSPNGYVMVVDFANLDGLPKLFKRGLQKWLATFHVEPVDEKLLQSQGAKFFFGPAHYYLIARMGPLT
jgi:S-adenosylmethionine-diacylgycerolhomoserine-N-methlytransferase